MCSNARGENLHILTSWCCWQFWCEILCWNLQHLLVLKSLDSLEYLPIPKFNKSIRHSQMFVSVLDHHWRILAASLHPIYIRSISSFKGILIYKSSKEGRQCKSFQYIKPFGICVLHFSNRGVMFVFLYVFDPFHISSLFVGSCSSGFWLEPLLP